MTKSLEDKVLEAIRRDDLVREGDLVAVGVSGGADSVCLLLALKALGDRFPLRLTAVHVEHGIRGEASLEDAEFVRDLCRREGIPCQVRHVDVPSLAGQGLSVEEAARMLRYRCLEECAAALGADRIAVAHHREDQAETVLLNLCRGTGLRGLGGMRPENGILIRPLLGVTKEEITAWLRARGQDWRTDETNESEDCTRNLLRRRIMPELNEVNARAADHICAAARKLQRADAFLEKLAGEREKDLVRYDAAGTAAQLDAAGLAAEDPLIAEYVVRAVLRRLRGGQGLKDISEYHVSSLLSLAAGGNGKSLSLPGGLVARRENRVIFVGQDERPEGVGDTVLRRERTGWPRDGAEFRENAEGDGDTTLRRQRTGCPPDGAAFRENEEGDAALGRQRTEEGRPVAALGRKKGAETLRPALTLRKLTEEGEPAADELTGADDCLTLTGVEERILVRDVFLPGVDDGPFLDFVDRRGSGLLSVERQSLPMGPVPQKRYTKWLSYDTMGGNLQLRTRRPGDYLIVNAGGGRRKLKDYLIDEKIPAACRDRVLLVTQGSHVLWVVGWRISEGAKVREGASAAVKLSFSPLQYAEGDFAWDFRSNIQNPGGSE